VRPAGAKPWPGAAGRGWLDTAAANRFLCGQVGAGSVWPAVVLARPDWAWVRPTGARSWPGAAGRGWLAMAATNHYRLGAARAWSAVAKPGLARCGRLWPWRGQAGLGAAGWCQPAERS
jgi:hypothetical protein